MFCDYWYPRAVERRDGACMLRAGLDEDCARRR
jgi:hypothetical protein